MADITFGGVTPEKMVKAREQLRTKFNVNAKEDSGLIEYNKVVIQYVYDVRQGTLSLTMTKNNTGWPSFIVRKKVKSALNDYKALLANEGIYQVSG